MNSVIKILVLEDNPNDADLLYRELKKSGLSFTSQTVNNREDFEDAIDNFQPDLILSDYSLPAFDAAAAFRIKQLKKPHIPFIIVSGIIGEENAVELIKEGVTDYTPKNKLFTLTQKIKRALIDSEEKKEKIVNSKKLKQQTEELIKANNQLIIQNLEKEKQAAELIAANKELLTFTYISSHDLQEPLRKIQAYALRILEKEHENLSENGKNMFRRMREASERMQILIQDLLAFSRLNHTEEIFENTSLYKIVDQVREDLKTAIEEKNATIEVGDMCEARIINFQFHQLILNLMSNALKFSNNNINPHINIESHIANGSKLNNPTLIPENEYCHIRFSDNGIGFEKEHSFKIFEVFQRLHTREEFAGTGIGLAIVKKIVENHNGIITATGELNKGATFDIYIPSLPNANK